MHDDNNNSTNNTIISFRLNGILFHAARNNDVNPNILYYINIYDGAGEIGVSWIDIMYTV